MFLQKLTLQNFKNHLDLSADFSEHCNCILGENGSGKTSLIDAIYFLSLTKSSLSNQEALCINHTEDYFVIMGQFLKNTKNDEVICSLQRGQRKAILIDKKPIERISDHIGNYPVVLMAPHDTDIVRDSAEARRKFFDGVISQIDPEYFQNLLQHNRLLLQRNSLLKQFADRKYYDQPLLEVYSEPLLEKAQMINKVRKSFLQKYLPIFQKHYAQLSENREEVTLFYESEVGDESFSDEFRQNYKLDVAANRTLKGIHKDDYIFEIDGFTLRKFGSQGQQKAFAMALKLAQFDLITIEKGAKPILLMDDIFDKLDDRRIQMLIDMIENKVLGQVFITDARPERSKKLLENISGGVNFVVM
ncbi:MAG: DNA replication and repair protein RecF [Bacteroidota bacterium]